MGLLWGQIRSKAHNDKRTLPHRVKPAFGKPLKSHFLFLWRLNMNRSITFILVGLLLTLLIISRVVASGVGFTKHIVDGEFDGAKAVMAADVDGDGDQDILGAAYDGEDIAWWANNGDGSVWTKHTVDARFNYASSVYATDIDRDGDVDIIGAALNVDGVTWWANNGNGSSWTEHSIGGELEAPKDLHAVDIDQDGVEAWQVL